MPSAEQLDAQFSTAPPGAAPTDHSVGGKVPLDADDMRGHHLKALFNGTAAKVVTLIFIVGAGVAGFIAAGPAIGAAAAGGALLLLLIIAWVMASGRAESDFFKAYAGGHGLQLQDGRGSLPPMTPLLQRGDARYTQKALNGTLPGGQDGTLALYTYEESTTDSNGNRSTTYMHFTVMCAQVSEFAPFMQELYAQRRVGFRFLDGAEDIFRKRQRVEHESEVVDKRYEIFCGANDDMNRAVQVLSPSSSSGSRTTRPRRSRSSASPACWSATSRATRSRRPSSTRSARAPPPWPSASAKKRSSRARDLGPSGLTAQRSISAANPAVRPSAPRSPRGSSTAPTARGRGRRRAESSAPREPRFPPTGGVPGP